MAPSLLALFLLLVSCGDDVREVECSSHEQCDGLLACVGGACVDLCEGRGCAVGYVCVRGVCYAQGCVDRSCPEGMLCLTGECVILACAAVDCEQGELCADGQCYPTDCFGTSCGLGVCVGGECVSRSCAGVDCPAGMMCARGECYPSDCQAACLANEVCVDDECVEADCVRVSCEPAFQCTEGRCVEEDPVECNHGLIRCAGQCVDTNTDFLNCGGCGILCGADQGCVEGECMACGEGRELCHNVCIDTGRDRDNCGGCDNQCAEDEMCLGGQCSRCADGLTLCGNTCIDTQRDSAHCGACGNMCAQGQDCNEAVCETRPFTCTAEGNSCYDHETCYSLGLVWGSGAEVQFLGCGTLGEGGLVDPSKHTTMITLTPCKDYGEVVRRPWHAAVLPDSSHVQGQDITSCPRYSTGEYLVLMESNFRCSTTGNRCVSLIEKEPATGCECSFLRYSLSDYSDNRPGREDNASACGPAIFDGAGQALAYNEIYADRNCHLANDVLPYRCSGWVGYAHYVDNGLCGN